MLKVQDKTHFQQLRGDIKDFDPATMTWIVADLPTKSKIQDQLLQRTSCLPEDAILRVSELWQKLLHRLDPDCEVVSQAFLNVCMTEWLDKRDLSWARHPNTAQIVSEYIAILLPAIAQSESRQMTQEWLRANTESFLRWGQWFELACEVWDYFSKQKLLAPTWVVGYLSQHEALADFWSRPIWLSVGPDLSGLEAELFLRLSQQLDVRVYQPEAVWRNGNGKLFWPYQLLSNTGFTHQENLEGILAKDPAQNAGQVSCRRFASPIAEVKEATALCRQWLKDGVSPSEIIIVTSKIEDYWPALSRYMLFEGLPVEKDILAAGLSFPSLTRWLARVKIESRELESSSLEAVAFQDMHTSTLSYEQFRQLFAKIYDEEDLKRDARIQALFDLKVNAQEALSRDQFFSWALQFWRDDVKDIESVFAQLLQECPAGVQLSLRSWVSYLSTLLAKIEIKIRPAEAGGIQLLNYDATLGAEPKKIIFLNLSEDALQEDSRVAITSSDVIRLSNDLGLHLPMPQVQPNMFYAQRLIAGGADEAYLFFSASDFQGEILAPSLFWLEKAMDSKIDIEEVAVPRMSRWDEWQWNPKPFDGMDWDEAALEYDRGLSKPPALVQLPALRYSPTQLKKYIDCPFVFMAEKLFYLSDLPDVDLDVDAMTSGRIQHAILDTLLTEPFRPNWKRPDLERLVDETRVRLAVPVADERLWPGKRESYVKLAERFLKFETEWRQNFPQTLTVAKEVRVKGTMSLVGSDQDSPVAVEVSGQIDRVDQLRQSNEKPRYVVMDYKASAGSLSQHTSWLKNDEWQLLFYAMAIEEGLTPLPKGEVIGAFYYVLSTMDREKGFRVPQGQDLLFAEKTRNKSPISETGLAELKKSFRERWKEIIGKISAGEFAPVPQDTKECFNCSWNTICRAPHLN